MKKDRERDSCHPYKVVEITPPPRSLGVRCFPSVQVATPISKGELGRSTWTFLHTLAAQDNIEWAKFRKDGFPQYSDLCIVFGDIYATGDYAVGNTEYLVVSEGEDNGSGGALVGDPNELSDGVFTFDVSATQVRENHKLDRTPNSKRRRKSSTYDIAGTCKAIQDMIKFKAGQSTSGSITSHAPPPENPYSMGAVVAILNDMPELE